MRRPPIPVLPPAPLWGRWGDPENSSSPKLQEAETFSCSEPQADFDRQRLGQDRRSALRDLQPLPCSPIPDFLVSRTPGLSKHTGVGGESGSAPSSRNLGAFEKPWALPPLLCGGRCSSLFSEPPLCLRTSLGPAAARLGARGHGLSRRPWARCPTSSLQYPKSVRFPASRGHLGSKEPRSPSGVRAEPAGAEGEKRRGLSDRVSPGNVLWEQEQNFRGTSGLGVSFGARVQRGPFVALQLSDWPFLSPGGCTKAAEKAPEEAPADAARAADEPQLLHGAGICKWFNVRMGFGFLSMTARAGVALDPPVDVFVHQ
ncbi:Hypothetical predicted protein, partial [Marmota monax]